MSEHDGLLTSWLRRRGWVRPDELTLSDLAAIGHRLGIRFTPKFLPNERPEAQPADSPIDMSRCTLTAVQRPKSGEYRPDPSTFVGPWKLYPPYRSSDGRVTQFWHRGVNRGGFIPSSWCGVILFYDETPA